MDQVVENQYKIILIGDTGTGKSSLILKFTDNTFSGVFNSTIGVDFRTKAFDVAGERVRFYIWDTAGQERFRAITRSYYNTGEGIILCFDISNKETFITLPLWMEELERHEKMNCPIIIVGTKSDLHDKRKVQNRDIIEFVDSYSSKFNVQYVETSSKHGKNIEEVFQRLGEQLLKIKSIVPKIENTTTETKVKNGCCVIL